MIIFTPAMIIFTPAMIAVLIIALIAFVVIFLYLALSVKVPVERKTREISQYTNARRNYRY